MISYSQNFEDVILWRAFKHVERGVYIDIGAQHPVIDSVSKVFYDNGWRGVSVEPVPEYARLLEEARPGEIVYQVAVDSEVGEIDFHWIPDTGLSTGMIDIAKGHAEKGLVAETIRVKTTRLSDLLQNIESPEIHWIKIDVEGMEGRVLEGWGSCLVRPWVLVIESTEPSSPELADLSWEQEVIRKGYSFVYFDGLNRFYLHKDHTNLMPYFSYGPSVFDSFKISDTSSNMTAQSQLHEKQRLREELSSSLYQLANEMEEKKRIVENLKEDLRRKEEKIDALHIKELKESEIAERQRLTNDHLTSQVKTLEEQTSIFHSFLEEKRAVEALNKSLSSKNIRLSARNNTLSKEILQLQKRCSQFVAEITSAHSIISENIDIIKNQSNDIYNLNSALQNEREFVSTFDLVSLNYEREIQSLKNKAKRAKNHHDILSKEIAALRVHNETIDEQVRRQNELYTQEVELRTVMEANMQSLISSTSWRITKPLRFVVNFFRVNKGQSSLSEAVSNEKTPFLTWLVGIILQASRRSKLLRLSLKGILSLFPGLKRRAINFSRSRPILIRTRPLIMDVSQEEDRILGQLSIDQQTQAVRIIELMSR